MTFLTTYSNITVDTQLTTGNLVANALQTSPTSLKIAGGLNGQAITALDFEGNITFNELPPFPKPAGPLANTQVIFADPTATNNMNVSPRFTYNRTVNQLAVDGNVTTVNLTAPGKVNLGNVSTVKIPGGANNSTITTDGNGNLSFLPVTKGSIESEVYQTQSSLSIDPGSGVLPAGTNFISYTTPNLSDTTLIQSGTTFTLSNDPQYVLTAQNVNVLTLGPSSYRVQVYFSPSTRTAAVTLPQNTTSVQTLGLSTFEGLLFSDGGPLITELNGENLIIQGLGTQGANTQLQYYDSNFRPAASNNLTWNNDTSTLTVNGTLQTNTISATGTVTVNNGVQFQGNGLLSTPTGNLTVVGNVNVAGTVTAGNFSRGVRYAQWRQTGTTPLTIPSSIDTAVGQWTAQSVIAPFETINNTGMFYDSVNKFYNYSGSVLNLLISYQITWPLSTSSLTTRFAYIFKNGTAIYNRYAISAVKNNSSGLTVQNGTVMLVLSPNDWIQLRVFQDSGAPLQVAYDSGGNWQNSTRLLMTCL